MLTVMRIAVYTIAKNEESHISRWAESAKDADVRLVLDTGSIDNTVALAYSLGCDVHTANVDPWRFDQARNMSLDLIPDDIDMCIALDADEVLQPGWRSALEAADLSITRPRYKYTWSWNDDGTPGLVYYGDKIHRRHGYAWRHPVHEVLSPVGGFQEITGVVDLEIHHHPDPGKERDYLPLLEMAVIEDPDDDRNSHYLGREYALRGMLDKAAMELQRHLSLPSARWAAERSKSMRLLATCLPDEAEQWLLRAAAEDPHHREAWLALSRHYYVQQQWEHCLMSSVRALSITERAFDYLSEGECWGWEPHDHAALSCHFLGMRERAADYGLEAIRRAPNDQRLLDNMAFYLKALPQCPRADVVIPTKSNPAVIDLVRKLVASPSVGRVIVVADGVDAHASLRHEIISDTSQVDISYVPLASGIHAMWNVGLSKTVGSPVLFLNDDVAVNEATIHGLLAALERCPELGLVCPNYAGERFDDSVIYRSVSDTCRGRYDGTGGIGGFAMMLRASLASRWRFDENMKWWYGDDDLVQWVTRTMGMAAGVASLATCSGNNSWTVTNDPPTDLEALLEEDRRLYYQKWDV